MILSDMTVKTVKVKGTSNVAEAAVQQRSTCSTTPKIAKVSLKICTPAVEAAGKLNALSCKR